MLFGVLGELSVAHEGRPIGVRPGLERTLLALLLSKANQRFSADWLIDALWGADPPAAAQKSLQVYVHRLRKLLGRQRIIHRSAGYELVAGVDELDASRFQGLAATGRSHWLAGRAAEAGDQLGQALSLWRGEPYGGLGDVIALEQEISFLAEQRLVVMEQWIEAELVLGRHLDLIPQLSALTASHPLRERFHAQLMTALHMSGRRADALGAYQYLRRKLVDEVGLEPGAELQHLQRFILNAGEDATGGNSHLLTGRAGQRAAPALREGELAPIYRAATG